jgi:hypothetical protein
MAIKTYINRGQTHVGLNARALWRLKMFSSPPTMSSRRIFVRTVHSEESVDDDEPVEANWTKGKGTKRKRTRKGPNTNTTAGPSVIPMQSVEQTAPAAYLGDPTEQEIIDNIRNLPDIRPGGKV